MGCIGVHDSAAETRPVTRPGRPRGLVSFQTLELAMRQEITARDVATTLQLSRRHASVTVHSLARSGHLLEVERREVAGARKPMPVYRAAPAESPPVTVDSPLVILLDWPRG